MTVIQRHVWVSGRVQGVSFRASMVAAAPPGLRGFVRNLPDGRVEALVQGPVGPVLSLVAWCGHGPAHAQVERLEVREEAPDESLPAFGIRV